MRQQGINRDKIRQAGCFLTSLLMALMLCTSVMAGDGDLDATFDGDGIATTHYGITDYGARAVAIQFDGKIIVAGYADVNPDKDFSLTRFNSDGSLDTSFNGNGMVTTDFNGGAEIAFDLALQPDGKIIVSGASDNNKFVMARYTIDGSLDTSFDGDGKVTNTFDSSSHWNCKIAIQADGKIVTAGEFYNGLNGYDFGVARYNTDGSLDTSFDGDGKVTTNFSGNSADRGCAVVIQPDGKIVVTGYTGQYPDSDIAVARYNTDGSLDTSFDGDGKLTTAIGSGDDRGNDIAIQPDGKIIVVGDNNYGANPDIAVVRYNIDGSLDTSFDGDGIVTTTIGSSYDMGKSISIQSDGKIVVAGYSDNGAGADFAVVRYNIDGSLDTSFNGDGIVTTDIGSDKDFCWAVTTQPDGKIVVAGSSNYTTTVVRYGGTGLPPSSNRHYVDADATGTNDGSSWENAFWSLQDALGAASAGDQVWVAAGNYYPDEGVGKTDGNRDDSFIIPSSVEVYGGFDGTDGVGGGTLETDLSQRDWTANVTILSGDLNQDDNTGGDNSDNTRSGVVRFTGATSLTELDGFVITAGNVDWSSGALFCGGGVVNLADGIGVTSHPKLTNCIISGNNTSKSGAGIFNYGTEGGTASPTFTNCTISDNNAPAYYGGGIYNYANADGTVNPIFTNCVIRDNSADQYGGGLFNYGGEGGTANPVLTNCTISGNSSGFCGGGIYNYSFSGTTNPILVNCAISGNTASSAGGGIFTRLYGGECNPELINCTISGNRAVENYGGGICSFKLTGGTGNPNLTNCIVWNNDAPSAPEIYNSSIIPAYAYCDIKDSGGSTSWDTTLGMDNGGNIDDVPLFVNPPNPAAAPTSAGDVHLLGDSPCINQGTSTVAPATDIDGDTRDVTPDIGVDEVIIKDSDGDGEPDITDGCPADPLKIAPGACGCGTPDTDTDGDGTADCIDDCPQDPLKTDPGICGCGTPDTDTDGDGAADCNDECPKDPLKTVPGVCGCGTPDTDTNGDGTPDCIAPVLLPPVANPGPDQTVSSNASVTLNGYGSYDPDGYIVSYFWEQEDGLSVTLTDETTPYAQFVSPTVAAGSIQMTFSLTVTDNDGLSSSESVKVTVSASGEEPCKTPPEPISPENGAVDLSLMPILVIDKDIDPVTCGLIHKVRWQISDDPDFHGLVYNRNVFDGDLFSHQVPPGVLRPETTYYWHAHIHCSSGCTSEYSTTSTFTTGKADNDANGNGIPDNQEMTGQTDLDKDGQPDNHGAHFKGVTTVVGNTYIAIATSENITSLQSLDNLDQDILDGMPDNMPWGLINFSIETANPGDTVQVTIYFNQKAPAGSVYYKYDPIDGWIDYSQHATFAPNMKSVTIEIQDGGFGDLDGVANGVIVDPGGIGLIEAGGSGGGGSCFLDTVLKP